jgi:hypothetical protein
MCDVPAQNLIEYVDINLPKLFLDAEPHSSSITSRWR